MWSKKDHQLYDLAGITEAEDEAHQRSSAATCGSNFGAYGDASLNQNSTSPRKLKEVKMTPEVLYQATFNSTRPFIQSTLPQVEKEDEILKTTLISLGLTYSIKISVSRRGELLKEVYDTIQDMPERRGSPSVAPPKTGVPIKDLI